MARTPIPITALPTTTNTTRDRGHRMTRFATMIVVIGLAGFAVLNGARLAALSWTGWGSVQMNESGWINRSSVGVAPEMIRLGDTAAQSVVTEQIAEAIGRS